MKSIIKSVFRPVLVSNRHYTNKKTSVIIYAFNFFPVVLICLYGAVFISSLFWIVLLGIVVSGIIDYVLFDAFLDKIAWKLIWRRFYGEEAKPRSPEQDIIKKFEQDPSSENYEALQKHLKTK